MSVLEFDRGYSGSALHIPICIASAFAPPLHYPHQDHE